MGHAEDGGAIETEAIASIADPPKPVGKPGEGPSLAEIRETPRLLNDVVASGRRVVNQVGMEAAELVQEVIGLTVDRSGIGGLLWLLTRRRYDGSQRRRGERVPGFSWFRIGRLILLPWGLLVHLPVQRTETLLGLLDFLEQP